MIEDKPLLTKQDLQRILSISERTLETRVRRGELPPPRRLGGGRRVYWEARSFRAWLRTQFASAAPASPRRRGRPRNSEHSR